MVKSVCEPVEISEEPLHEIIYQCLRNNPDRIALVNGVTDESFTSRETEAVIRRVASGLQRAGVKKGEVVMLFSPNSPEFLITIFAVSANGAATTLPNPSYTTYELCHALKLTKASWVVTIPKLYDHVKESAKQINANLKGIILIGQTDGRHGNAIPFSRLLSDDGSRYPVVKINVRKDAVVIPFSSGTTGLPKGVLLSHYNVVAMISIIGGMLKDDTIHLPGEQGVMIEFLPLYHCYGLIGVSFLSIAAGFKLVILPRFQLDQTLAAVAKYKVTMMNLVPPILVYLTKNTRTSNYDLSSIRRFGSGAAPLSFDTESEFKDKFKANDIRQGFGMTETTLICTFNIPGKPCKAGSVGQPTPNTEVEIIDVETGKSLSPNQRGEVVVKGPQVMLGYLNNPEQTKAAIDSNNWLHTGDVGYYDEDGYFFIVDRIKELIKYKGFQVAPAELESLLLTHPSVADTAVIGVPDAVAGEVPKAFIVIKPDCKLTENEIKQFVASKVSNYKHLRGGVEFLKTIPKSETGKILRRVLRDKSTTTETATMTTTPVVPQHKL